MQTYRKMNENCAQRAIRVAVCFMLACMILAFGGCASRDSVAERPAHGAMILVEGGSFTMGGDSGFERPPHEVTVSSFYMGQYEVTQAEWLAVMGSNPAYFKGENLPVETVSWYDAVAYCNALSRKEGLTPVYSGEGDAIRMDVSADGYRLPTEAEWEYAARGGKFRESYEYSGGDDIDEVAWFWRNSGNGWLDGVWGDWNDVKRNNCKTHPVGLKQPNALGLYDMCGNVWEWCWDWYGEYEGGAQTNPTGLSSGTYRARRGGSWERDDEYCRVSSRMHCRPGYRYYYVGLRVVRSGEGEILSTRKSPCL